MNEMSAPSYYVWGIDNVAYGPVELPGLVDWVRDERVLPESSVYETRKKRWVLASEMQDLTLILKKKAAAKQNAAPGTSFAADSLRRIKLFSQMDVKSLESLLHYMEKLEIPAFQVIVRQGEEADGMYFVLQGEVRAFVVLDGRETTLATLGVGEMFGEIALLESGQRTAHVAANTESVLLKLSEANFRKVLKEAPSLAAPFATELARCIAARLRQITKQYGDSIRFSRAAHQGE